MLLAGLLSGERDPTGRLRYGGDLETLVRLYGGDLGRRPGDLELHLLLLRRRLIGDLDMLRLRP